MANLPSNVVDHVQTARDNIRLALAIRNRKAAQISREAGLSANTLANFLNGKASISYPGLLAICDALDVPIGIIHHPHAITPQRLMLQSILSSLPASEVAEIAQDLERDPTGAAILK